MKRMLRCLAYSFMGAGAGLLLYCGSFYIKSYLENRQVQKQYETIRETCLKEDADSRKKEYKRTEKKTHHKKEKIRKSFGICWEELWKINPKIKGWITVPGADISYPVVQGDDDEFYLTHSLEGKSDPFGSIFLGSGNNGDFLDSHSLIYGHNMEGQMMFANLNRYECQEFLESCPEFVITTPERQFWYEIFSAEQAEEGSMAFRYGYETGSEEYKEQLELLRRNSLYDTGVFPNEQQKMASLVTCNSSLDTKMRMVIHGICRKIVTKNE